jgi:eukaryotic-like serine/threonine-protein kinase
MTEPQQSAGPDPPQPDGLTGRTIGRFRIGPLLGRGGMGEVYQAEDTGLQRIVALKRITPALHADLRSRARLWNEAQMASRLKNPCIAAVHDVLQEGPELLVVMEFVEGKSLRDRISRPIEISEFLAIAEQCVEALSAAHAAGVLHRDIKPENIMLTPAGQVKILDFGLAHNLADEGQQLTQSTLHKSGVTGTPGYMSPEQIEARPCDGRSDIFSLGIVFYEALAGPNPFHGASFLVTCNRILQDEPQPLEAANSLVPAELARIVAKMLAKDPSLRYATAADLAADLRALRLRLSGLPGESPRPLPSLAKRRGARYVALFLACAALAAAGLGIYHYYYARPVLTEHASLLVADFDNQTSEKLFDSTVTEAMRQALAQSRYVRVVPRTQVAEALARTGHGPTTRVDATIGRELCSRENYRAMLAGQITGSPSAYTISVELVDPSQDSPVLVETGTLRSPGELYPTVDKLASRLRRRIGESLSQISQSSVDLARVTTPSLEALKRYSQALDYYAAGDYQGFLPLAKSAVEIDPDFAMAHLYLASAYQWLGDSARAREQLELAKRGLDRVTEPERHLIFGVDRELQESFEGAFEEYRLLTELYPDDLEAYQGLAGVAVWAGQPEAAIQAERKAIELNPHSAIDHRRLIMFLVRQNHFSEALAAYQQSRALGLKDPQLHRGAGLAYLAMGDTAAARAQFDAMRQEGGPIEASIANLALARIFLYEGRLNEAASTLSTGTALDQRLGSTGWLNQRRSLLAQTLLLQGRTSEARSEYLEFARAALQDPEAENLRRAGLLAIALNDPAMTRKLLAALDDLHSKQPSAYTQSCYYNLAGAVELSSGHPEAAVQNQQRAIGFFDTFTPYPDLGEAFSAQERWRNSAETWERYLKYQGEIISEGSPAEWVLGHLRLARALAKAGDPAAARGAYGQFLKLWEHADPDIPDLRQARAEDAKLLYSLLPAPANR